MVRARNSTRVGVVRDEVQVGGVRLLLSDAGESGRVGRLPPPCKVLDLVGGAFIPYAVDFDILGHFAALSDYSQEIVKKWSGNGL